MREKLSIREIFFEISLVFFVSIMAVSIMGVIVGGEVAEESNLYLKEGIRFSALFQFAGYAVIVVIIRYLCMTRLLFKKLSYLFRGGIFVLTVWIVTIAFWFLFRWFLFTDVKGWIDFNISFFISFMISAAVFFILFRNKEKKYEKLLADYKRKKEMDKK